MRALATVLVVSIILGLLLIFNPKVQSAFTWQLVSSGTSTLPTPNGGTQQTASIIFDVDNDGDNDFMIAERTQAPSVVLFRRTTSGWTKSVVDNTLLKIEASGDYTDIDSDGDLDVVFGGDASSNQIWWWENPNPNFTGVWTRRFVKNTGANKHHDTMFADVVPGDNGKKELVFWNQSASTLNVAPIPVSPKTTQPWPYYSIFTASSSSAEGLAAADINNDGKMDIVGAGYWFEHTSGQNFSNNLIVSGRLYSRSAAGQLVPGGYSEVVIGSGDSVNKLAWYQYVNNVWVEKVLVASSDHGHSLSVMDFNKDGLLDIFAAEMRLNGDNADSKTQVFINNGNGTFTTEDIASGFDNHESKPADLDGDSDIDILGKPYNYLTPKLNIWLQQGGIGNITPTPIVGGLKDWQRHVVDSAKPWKSLFITGADMDGDGKKDIVTGGWWYKNPGLASGSWGTRRIIGSPLNNSAIINDFDSDGDLDIMGSQWNDSGANSNLSWAQNNGSGVFSIKNNITNATGDFLQGAVLSNFSGKKIALSYHAGGNGVQTITVPSDPVTQNWSWQNITATNQQEDLSAADIDKDGDNDLLLGTKWLRLDGTSFTPFTLFNTTDLPDRNELFDMDNDGKLDAVVGYEAISKAGKLAWYKQPSTSSGLWTEKIIASDIIGPMSLDIADLDGDSDPDLVVGEHSTSAPTTAKLFVLENLGGANSFTKHLIYTGDEHHMGTQLYDIDNDSDLDILSIGWTHGRVLLYENLSSDGSGPFGNPTLTPIAGSTLLNLNLKLHGIGTGGDNINPQASGNMNPINPVRSINLELFNSSNQSMGVYIGSVNFNSAAGNFTGTVNLGANITGGAYTANIKTAKYLGKTYQGIINITKNQTNSLPLLSLTVGDSNGDNKLSVLDYNIILDCYSELLPPKNCADLNKKQSSDLTDDGLINQFDYNLFIRELSAQSGDGISTFPTNVNTLPTATSIPQITNQPGNEKVLFNNMSFQFTSSDNGFHVLKQNGVNIPGIPVNWLSPQDYYNGTWYFRYQIVTHPTDIPGKIQVCVWNMPGFSPENCSGNIDHTGVGTYYLNSVPASWWKKNGVPLDFTNSTPFLIRAVLRGQSGCNVTTFNVANGCPEQFNDYKDMVIKLTVVMVPKNQIFSGWSNY